MSASSPAPPAPSPTCPSSTTTSTPATACPSAAAPTAASIIFSSTTSPSTAPTTASASSPIAAAAASSIRSSIATSASATCPTRSSSRRTTPHFTGDRLPIYKDITLENVHILTPGAYTFFGLDADHKLEIKLDNVFADDQKDSLFYDKDADITVGPSLGNLEPKGDDVAITQTPGSAPGQPLDCDARFVPFPEDKTAPEMAGKIPPEDKTFYVAADGTGDYYSIQRALDMAPKTGGAVLIRLARRLSRSAHRRQAQHHHSQRQS